MAEYVAPSLTTKIDIIVTFLMKHVNHQEGLRTLDIVLDHALDPPSDLSGFIQTLITISQQANSEHKIGNKRFVEKRKQKGFDKKW